MLFNSAEFLLFFPVVLFGYYLLPKRLKKYFLLAASYYFYMSWNRFYAVFILGSTLVTYLCGLWIFRCRQREKEGEERYGFGGKPALFVCLVLNLGLLGIFKYADFLLDALDSVGRLLHLPAIHGRFDLLLPVGISFYTFQAIGYVMDVYRGELPAEKNLCRYALFVSFFPQLVAGPIERSKSLLGQLERMDRERIWHYDGLVRGFALTLYGFLLKIVLADRLALWVDAAYGNIASADSLFLLLGALCFSFQIYFDFAGYSLIAIGTARMMGIRLMDNFHAPYLAASVREFWSRWHISLSSWFRDYLYIPLGGNRKGKIRTYQNLLLTFLISGLWHGAGWTFVLWGLLHGIYQVIERALGKEKPKEKQSGLCLLQRFRTFVLVTFAWIFFRASSVGEAFRYLGHLLTNGLSGDRELWKGLMTKRDLLAMAPPFLLVFLLGILYEKKKENPDDVLLRLPLPIRFVILIGLFFFLVFFGKYGQGAFVKPFVYFQF